MPACIQAVYLQEGCTPCGGARQGLRSCKAVDQALRPPYEQTAARLKSATLGQLDTRADRISPSDCRDSAFRRAALTGSDIHAMGLVGGHIQTPFA
jgi:hypothetical protein